MTPCRRAEVAFTNLRRGAYLNVYDERRECCGFNHQTREWVKLTERQIRLLVTLPYS